MLHQQGQNISSEGPQGLCSALSLVGPVMILAGFPLVRGSQHSVVKGPPAFKTSRLAPGPHPSSLIVCWVTQGPPPPHAKRD